MPHQPGAKLACSVSTLADLRGRCVIRPGSDCWHFRLADGRPMSRATVHRMWVHGRGTLTVTRAAWLLAGRNAVPAGVRIARTCESYDCCNPEHLAACTGAEVCEMQVLRGTTRPAAKLAACRRIAAARSTLTPELRRWLMESPQTGVDAAHGLGVTQSRANVLRVQAGAVSVFGWRPV